MIDGFTTGVILMAVYLVLLTVLALCGAVLIRQARERSLSLLVCAGLPTVLLLAGVTGAVFLR